MAVISDKAMQAKPGESDVWLIEAGARGEGRLVGRITPAGARSFYYRYTASGGDRVRLLIGPYDPRGDGKAAFTVQQARDKARDLSGLYRAGVRDLREHFQQAADDQRHAEEARRTAAAETARIAELQAQRRLTVRQLFERWRTTELQPVTRADGKRAGRKDGGAYVFQQFERHVFPAIGHIAITEVRKADVLALIDLQKAKGQLRTASVLLGDLRQMMGFALDRELIDADPLASIKKARIVGVAVERDRALSDQEIRLLGKALPAARMNARSETAVWLLIATGVRVGELIGAVWSDALSPEPKAAQARLEALQTQADKDGAKVGVVNLPARTWHLPDTKNQRSHTVHLSDFALAHFTRLAALREALPDSDEPTPWAFPARDARRPVCVKSFGKQLSDRQRDPDRRMSGRSKATQSLQLPGGRWTAHDLRRTAGTLMAGLGTSGDVIDECLNHMIESRVRRIYIRDRRQTEQARAFDALGAKLSDLARGTSTAPNVISLRVA
ncbi:MAG: tyrosine-type recombinase/integrase [Burkholderiaceae bacterium]